MKLLVLGLTVRAYKMWLNCMSLSLILSHLTAISYASPFTSSPTPLPTDLPTEAPTRTQIPTVTLEEEVVFNTTGLNVAIGVLSGISLLLVCAIVLKKRQNEYYPADAESKGSSFRRTMQKLARKVPIMRNKHRRKVVRKASKYGVLGDPPSPKLMRKKNTSPHLVRKVSSSAKNQMFDKERAKEMKKTKPATNAGLALASMPPPTALVQASMPPPTALVQASMPPPTISPKQELTKAPSSPKLKKKHSKVRQAAAPASPKQLARKMSKPSSSPMIPRKMSKPMMGNLASMPPPMIPKKSFKH